MLDPWEHNRNDKRMTLAEFLEWEAEQHDDNIYELCDGRVVVKDAVPVMRDGHTVLMSAPSPTHQEIVNNLGFALRSRLQGSPCRAIQHARVPSASRAEGFYIPDVIVTCQPRPEGHKSPKLVAEVASPTTRDYDGGRKLDDYHTIDTVMEIVLASSDKRRVRLWQRDASKWIVQDFIGSAIMPLLNFNIEIPLDEIYAQTDL